MQVQPISAASAATYAGASPATAQTPAVGIPQAQPSVHVPTQQQVPNNQVLYATAPAAMPLQGGVPQLVPHDPAQYQPGVLPVNPGVTPAAPVAGQTDMNTNPYAVPAVQAVVSSHDATKYIVERERLLVDQDIMSLVIIICVFSEPYC